MCFFTWVKTGGCDWVVGYKGECKWKPEVDIRNHLPLPFTLFLQARSQGLTQNMLRANVVSMMGICGFFLVLWAFFINFYKQLFIEKIVAGVHFSGICFIYVMIIIIIIISEF